jgi:hypothetical protein
MTTLKRSYSMNTRKCKRKANPQEQQYQQKYQEKEHPTDLLHKQIMKAE